MPVKLLIDEDLSPSIALALCADGIDACHVRDRKMLGGMDHRVLVVRAAVEFMQTEDMANRAPWIAPDGTMKFEDIPPG